MQYFGALILLQRKHRLNARVNFIKLTICYFKNKIIPFFEAGKYTTNYSIKPLGRVATK
jgi:hypothetical protein